MKKTYVLLVLLVFLVAGCLSAQQKEGLSLEIKVSEDLKADFPEEAPQIINVFLDGEGPFGDS